MKTPTAQPGPGKADPQAGHTYVLTSTIRLHTGNRYVLKRSDGAACNVDRSALCAIMRHGQLWDEHKRMIRYVV